MPKNIIIQKNDSGIRLDKFLTKYLKKLPASLMYKFIRTKRIKVNSARAKENTILSEGDVISFYISDEFFGEGANESAFEKIKPNFKVIFEDSNLLIVYKPSGLIVHSDSSEEYNTLINHIKAYLYKKGEYIPENELSFAPALCNRIDRNTEGLVIAAKNAEALRIMNEKIKNREITKKYLCAVHGLPEKTSFKIKGYIKKLENENRVVFSENSLSGSKSAETAFKVLKQNKNAKLSLLEAELITGRTHQIRAQLAAYGFALVGDGKYAKNAADRKLGFYSQALCSYSLEFCFSGQCELNYLNGKKFTSPEPDFLKLFN